MFFYWHKRGQTFHVGDGGDDDDVDGGGWE